MRILYLFLILCTLTTLCYSQNPAQNLANINYNSKTNNNDTNSNSPNNMGINSRWSNNNIFSVINEKSDLGTPEYYSLSQNYPNPFNPSTLIKFTVPFTSEVIIEVANILGNKVGELLNEQKPPGYYGINFNAIGLPSGVYFYSIKTNSIEGKQHFSSTKKMLILK